MQFSYGISEADYLQAWKLHCRGIARRNTPKLVLFWAFVFVCLLMLWVVVSKGTHSETSVADNQATASEEAPESGSSSTHAPVAQSLFWNVGPFVLIGGIWVFLVFRMLPGRRLRKIYRNDPAMQGRYTVEITPDGIAMENTAGATGRSGWNLYEYWTEGKDLIVLGLRSQAYVPIPLSELALQQREELRGLLSSVLSRK